MSMGLSIAAFAKYAGVPESTLRSAETGRHVAALPFLHAWAAALGRRLILISEDPAAGPWLVWSVRQHGWLAADGTHTNLWLARRFTDKADVDETLARVNPPAGDKRYLPVAIAVLAPESGRGGLTPVEIVQAPVLMSARIREQLRPALDGAR